VRREDRLSQAEKVETEEEGQKIYFADGERQKYIWTVWSFG